jgi:hypothetical protein
VGQRTTGGEKLDVGVDKKNDESEASTEQEGESDAVESCHHDSDLQSDGRDDEERV